MTKHNVFKTQLGGKELIIETGKYAGQADGAVIVRCEDNAILVTATASEDMRDGIDFFPLSVEYEERMYSVGKIPGGFIKKEGRPSERAILTSRLIDRPIRPLFPKGYYNDVQIIATCLSIDNEVPPEILAMIGSSAALSISGIPFAGPTGSVLVGMVDGEFIINPDLAQRADSKLHLVVSGTKDAVMMVEAGADLVTEEEMLNAILFAHEEIKKICTFIEEIKDTCGKPLKEDAVIYKTPEEIVAAVRAAAYDKVVWSLDTFDRTERESRTKQVNKEIWAQLSEQYPDNKSDVSNTMYALMKEVVRKKITDQGIRPDGRDAETVRPIWCETGLLSRTHGSAVFTRGQTQVLSIVTLGGLGEGQTLDGISEDVFKRYMHQYNMPPYSTGEAKMLRASSRREVGHGALAERAILPMLPSEDEFPYAIRTVSEVISSNGSTSMGSTCASSMALMNAGVPMKSPVAGVAMGLIKDEETGKIAVLTDIQGFEDFLGDMDFKVTGNAEGITAIQMDIKIKGIDKEILQNALEQAKRGRLHIMGEMNKVISQASDDMSDFAPKIIRFNINPDKIRDVIGPGGKTINKIIAETGVKIDIEDDGRVFIVTPDSKAADKAKKIIGAIGKDIEAGEVFTGKVVRLMNFGAFVELVPGKDGLVHISKLADHRVEKVEDIVKEGDIVTVKVVEVDKQGRINLTMKGVPQEGGIEE